MEIVVVTAVMNNEIEFEKTKNSVLKSMHLIQSWVVVDSSEKKLNLSGKKIRYHWEPPCGIFPAMQSGLNLVKKNSLVLFLNSGDKLLVEGLNYLLDHCPSSTLDVICLPIINPQQHIEYFLPFWYYKIGIIPLSHQGLLVRRDLISFEKKYTTIADLSLFRKLMEDHGNKWGIYREPLVSIAPMNIATKKKGLQRKETFLYLLRNRYFFALIIRIIFKIIKIKVDRPVYVD